MPRDAHITADSSSEKVKAFMYLGSLLTNQNAIHEKIKFRLKAGNSCFYVVQTFLSSRLSSKNFKIKIYITIILPVVAIWLCNMYFWIEGGMQAKDI